MSRSVKKWVGKTDDTKPPPRVRLRVFEAHGGRCHLTGRKIQPGDDWELDHIVALVNGGTNDEDNLAPAIKEAHRKKTATDVAIKKKDRRVRSKHFGAHKPKSSFPTSRKGPFKAKIWGGTVRRDEE